MIQQYDYFAEIGFAAGVIGKGKWKSQKEIYSKIETEIAGNVKKVIIPKQCHGADISYLDQSGRIDGRSVDGIITANDSFCLTICTADCIPLLLAHPQSGTFGAIHIGWRGLVGGIVDKMFYEIKKLDIRLDGLYILLGPAIGDCCLEVGPEVAVLFDDRHIEVENSQQYLDIKGAVLDKLISYGVSENMIQNIAECTSCEPEKYYSYRRDGNAAIQMVSYICKK